MSYTVTLTNGTTIATIPDGTVNTTTTSLALIGKNYAGYGIFLNENFVELLENFSNSTPPTAPLTGQLWWDNVNDVLKVYNSANNIWKPISSSISQSTAPSSLTSVTGDLWWNTTTAQLNVYSGSSWVTIGPAYTSTSGTSGAIVQTILDTGSASHVVVIFYISNSAIAILSKDTTFTPQTAIPGFATIVPGFNLISQSTLTGSQFTGQVSNALTLQGYYPSQFLPSYTSASTSYPFTAAGGLTVGSDLVFNAGGAGTAYIQETTNNKNIAFQVNQNGVTQTPLTLYGNSLQASFAGAATIAGNLTVSGITTLGSLNIGPITSTGYINTTANVSAATVNTATINAGFANIAGNVLAQTGTFNGVTLNGSLNASGQILPTTTNAYSIGTTLLQWQGIYAQNFYGRYYGDGSNLTNVTATGALAIDLIGSTLSSNVTASTLTSVGILTSLNTSGNVLAAGGIFNALTINGTTNTRNVIPTVSNTYTLGSSTNWFSITYSTSIQAQYADLAENYTADAEYAPGTVVQIGGVNEITLCDQDSSEDVFGVISTNPAYLMNSTLAGDNVLPVALQGRTPVRVVGIVKKGDRLVAAGAGVARAAAFSEVTPYSIIGRALENKTTDGEALVEAVVRLNS
jgi:hypothetical protein